MSRARTTAVVLACVAALAARAAQAQQQAPEPSVEDEHRRGMEARVAHRDVDARDIFRRLYERTREPRALARQALAEGAMGAWADAEEHLVAALEARDDPWIRANRAALEENLALFRGYLASLDVAADAPGAELWVDDRRIATLPLARPLRVAAGEVHFEVRAPGRTPARWRQRVEPNTQPLRVAIELAEAPPPPPALPPPPTVQPPPPRPPAPPSPSPAPPRTWMRPAGVAALSVGAAGVVFGAVMLGLAHRNEGSFDAMGCRDVARGARPDCDSLESDAVDRLQPAALGLFVAGGVLSVGGLALWLAAPSRAPDARSLLPCAPAGAGLRCTVAF